MLRAEADAGRTFVWYSTEMDEIALCDRVYVFRDGVIVAELDGRGDHRGQHPRGLVPGRGRMKRMSPDTLRVLVPALSLAVLLGASFWLQPRAMSYIGLNLLFNLAVPIALATIAQMIDHGGQRPRPVDGHLRQLRRLRDGDLPARRAADRRADPRRRDRRSMRRSAW